MRYKMGMASSQDISHILKPKPTPAKPPKKRPILGKDTPKAKADGGPSPLVEEPHHPDFPILWVSKGDFTEVSKKVRESISDSWKVKPIGNTLRPGSLVTKDDVSVWIQPDISPDDTLEGVIRRYVSILFTTFFYPNLEIACLHIFKIQASFVGYLMNSTKTSTL